MPPWEYCTLYIGASAWAYFYEGAGPRAIQLRSDPAMGETSDREAGLRFLEALKVQGWKLTNAIGGYHALKRPSR
jgi:hypothetical protein